MSKLDEGEKMSKLDVTGWGCFAAAQPWIVANEWPGIVLFLISVVVFAVAYFEGKQ